VWPNDSQPPFFRDTSAVISICFVPRQLYLMQFAALLRLPVFASNETFSQYP
jgi:hypothetical protein